MAIKYAIHTDGRVSAAQLMSLYEVPEHECVVLEDRAEHRAGYTEEFLETLLHLRVHQIYVPVSGWERSNYPKQPSRETS